MKLTAAVVLALCGVTFAVEKKKPYYLPSYESSLSSGFAAPYGSSMGGSGMAMGSSGLAGAPGQSMTHPQQAVVSNSAMYTAGAVNPYSVDTGLYYKPGPAGARFRAKHGASDFAAQNDVFTKEQLRAAAGKNFPPGAGAPPQFMQGSPMMMQQMQQMQQQQQQMMWGGMQGGQAPSDLMQQGTGAGALPSAYSKAQREHMTKLAAKEHAGKAPPASAMPKAKPAAAS